MSAATRSAVRSQVVVELSGRRNPGPLVERIMALVDAHVADEKPPYDKARGRILASIELGIQAEEDWDGPSIKPGTLTDEQLAWLAAWLAGEGIS